MAAAYAGHAATVQTLIDMNCDVNVAREKPSKSKLDKYVSIFLDLSVTSCSYDFSLCVFLSSRMVILH